MSSGVVGVITFVLQPGREKQIEQIVRWVARTLTATDEQVKRHERGWTIDVERHFHLKELEKVDYGIDEDGAAYQASLYGAGEQVVRALAELLNYAWRVKVLSPDISDQRPYFKKS